MYISHIAYRIERDVAAIRRLRRWTDVAQEQRRGEEWGRGGGMVRSGGQVVREDEKNRVKIKVSRAT